MRTARNMISQEILRKLLDTEKLKYCYECGICTASCPINQLMMGDYNPRELLETTFLNLEAVLMSPSLWLCAWCYRCYRRCPQALKLPEIFLALRKIATEHGYTQPLGKALKGIIENVPLPLVALSVCFHPERAGLDIDQILEKAEELYEESLSVKKSQMPMKGSEGRVAVIGSGPAGLTVAGELSKKGCKTSIFEALSEPGGMLRKCIPNYRLPREVLNKEIKRLKDLGVDIRTGVEIGKDLNYNDLWKEGFKAIFVGSGAHKSRRMKIDGGDLKGVVYALDFLWNVNLKKKPWVGENVTVIGGGNVAVDAARTALRLGAEKATMLYRRSREEMPANPWDVEEAESDGVRIEFLVAPKKILGRGGKVSGVECLRMQLGELDETGRRRPIPVEGSEVILKTDMTVLAIGETPDLGFLPKEVVLNDDGTIWVNPITMQTNLQGIFAGGDVVTGPATVIEAILAGKQAAAGIERYLKSEG